MMYPYMTLNDNTEITHSKLQEDGTVKVYIETPCYGGFQCATCILPEYRWEDIQGYSVAQMKEFDAFVHHNAHLIMQLAAEGGFLHATAV
mgnify:CR=1 FL=1